jgi:hypothetical protein
MSNEIARNPDDDGFYGSVAAALSKSMNYVNWTDANGWTDRDGLPMPSPQLVFSVDEVLRRWKANVPDYIRDKPLPDVETLNGTIPRSEWEKGLDGNPRAPWEHCVIAGFVDPATGKASQYTAPTRGAHIAVDELREQVITMRALRGIAVIPVVNLEDRPFKTNWGMRKRPYLHIIGWKSPGGDGPQSVPAKSPTPQLPGPATAEKPSPASADSAPKPKPAVNLGDNTLDAMKDVTPPSTGEIMDDSIPW